MADGTPDLSDDLVRACVLALTARIVAAHLANAGNRIGCSALPDLIQVVHTSLARARTGTAGSGGLVPAVPIARSVFPDYIIRLGNGRRFRSMRRHLIAAFGLTPEQYRRQWGLPHDRPQLCPQPLWRSKGYAPGALRTSDRGVGAQARDPLIHRPGLGRVEHTLAEA